MTLFMFALFNYLIQGCFSGSCSVTVGYKLFHIIRKTWRISPKHLIKYHPLSMYNTYKIGHHYCINDNRFIFCAQCKLQTPRRFFCDYVKAMSFEQQIFQFIFCCDSFLNLRRKYVIVFGVSNSRNVNFVINICDYFNISQYILGGNLKSFFQTVNLIAESIS